MVIMCFFLEKGGVFVFYIDELCVEFFELLSWKIGEYGGCIGFVISSVKSYVYD